MPSLLLAVALCPLLSLQDLPVPMEEDPAFREFAEKVETAAGEGDSAGFNRLLDFGALADRAFQGLELEPADKAGFMTGVRGSWKLAKEIQQASGDSGSYRFLRFRIVDKTPRALFRHITAECGVNYHEYLLEKDSKGRVHATDLHVFLTGQWMSEILRWGILGVKAAEPGALGKLLGEKNEFLEEMKVLARMKDLIGKGEHGAVLALYDGISEEMKKNKIALVYRITAAGAVGEKEALEALEDMVRFHPNDSATLMHSIDRYTYRKEFDKAIAAVDQVEKALGGDPYLIHLRGCFCILSKDYEKARAYCREAIEADPTLLEPYWGLVTISLEEKKFDDTGEGLSRIEEAFDMEFQDLTKIPEYAEFVKSKEYEAWMTERTPKVEPAPETP